MGRDSHTVSSKTTQFTCLFLTTRWDARPALGMAYFFIHVLLVYFGNQPFRLSSPSGYGHVHILNNSSCRLLLDDATACFLSIDGDSVLWRGSDGWHNVGP